MVQQELATRLKALEPFLPRPDELNFGPFGNRSEYIEVNRALVQRLLDRLPNNFVHVDVATGTGMVPKLLIEGGEKRGKTGVIIGIDPNPVSLAIARKETPQSNNFSVAYIEGYGQDTEELVRDLIPQEGADSVSIHDAIHEIPGEGKRDTIRALIAIAKPGAFFTQNSSFHTKAMEGVAIRWGKWNSFAHKALGRIPQRADIEILSPEDYRAMLTDEGLEIVHEDMRGIMLSVGALQDIALYPRFLEGVFVGMDSEEIPLVYQSAALRAAATQLGVDGLPRNWYELIAQKPKSPMPDHGTIADLRS